ncbi:MAG: hypothetical protein HFG30_06300 [Eubacterium sp.]|nr:hypothetical protein [Eubacterium sp.]
MIVEETTNTIQNSNGYIPQFGWSDILLIILLIVIIIVEAYRHRNDGIDTLTDWEMENYDKEDKRNNL